MLIEIMPDEIKDVAGARIAMAPRRATLKKLLNLVEELAQANTILRQQVQDLRDENARLKGEQGKPDIKGNKKGLGQDGPSMAPKRATYGHFQSSEKERRALGGEAQGERVREAPAKNAQIKVDRTEVVKVARSELPSDGP
jgi:hypothetical protein